MSSGDSRVGVVQLASGRMRQQASAGIFTKDISQFDRPLPFRQSLTITGFVEWIFIFVASFRALKGHLRGGRREAYETHSLHQHFNRSPPAKPQMPRGSNAGIRNKERAQPCPLKL